jgi:hypothetical protein
MKPITEAELRQSLADLERQLPAPGFGSDAEGTGLVACHVAALKVLAHYFGVEWVKKHTLAGITGDRKPSSFLSLEHGTDTLDGVRRGQRVISLAEMLVNFHDIDSSEHQFNKLKNLDVESATAELESAELLYKSDIPFEFRQETGTKGQDYDIEAVLGNKVIACETKRKVEGGTPDVGPIRNALGDARDQLPTDKPCIVFLRVPETWSAEAEAGTLFQAAIRKVGSGRISAVIVRWEEYWRMDENSSGMAIKLRTEHNHRARYPLTQFGDIIRAPLRTETWRRIPAMIGRPTSWALTGLTFQIVSEQ